MIARITDKYELGLVCPAAVEINASNVPTILINKDVFPKATDFAQRFYLAHELGHYIMQTGDEEVADAFALGALSGTEGKSLKKSLAAINAMETIPYERLMALYRMAEHIDSNQKKNLKKQNIMSNRFNKRFSNNYLRRADGEDYVENPEGCEPKLDYGTENTAADAANAAAVIGDIIVGNNRRRAGLRINNVFFSMESLVLSAILIVAIIIACKK